MTLQLKYAFTPSPFPVRASAPGENPSLVDVQVIIDNTSGMPITLTAIIIDIPTGSDSGSNLSEANLPAPQAVNMGAWTVTTLGSQITIQMSDNQPGTIAGDSLVFMLSDIAVNTQPGTVQITVSEIAPSGMHTKDDQTYILVKQLTNFPVSNFYSAPATVTDVNEPVTIYWSGSDQVVYDLYSDTLAPLGCLNSDSQAHCYVVENGIASVTLPSLQHTTVFTLQVIQRNPNGSSTLLDTLLLTVNVDLPALWQDSVIAPITAYPGQTVVLQWIAVNTSSVSIFVDGVLVNDAAPLNTYPSGFSLVLPNTTNPSVNIIIRSYSATKNTHNDYSVPPITLLPLQHSYLAGQGFDNGDPLTVTPVPNTTSLFFIDNEVGVFTLYDYEKNAVIGNDAFVNSVVSAVSDGENIIIITYPAPAIVGWAVVSTMHTGNTNWVLNSLPVSVPIQNTQATQATALAYNPSDHSTLISVTNGRASAVGVIDFAHQQIKTIFTTPDYLSGLAVASDGSFILAASATTIYVYDTATQKLTSQTGTGYGTIVLAPDNQNALLFSGSTITHITLTPNGITSQSVNTSNPVTGLAITPDSQIAIATLQGTGAMATQYDVSTLQALVTLNTDSGTTFLGSAAVLNANLAMVAGWMGDNPALYLLTLPPTSPI